MASRANIITFYNKLFNYNPDEIEYINFKYIVNENLPRFCEMVATNYRLFTYYDNWKEKYFNHMAYINNFYDKHDDIYTLKNHINEDANIETKLKYFYLKYDKKYLCYEELQKKLNAISKFIDILDDVLFGDPNEQEEHIDFLLNI